MASDDYRPPHFIRWPIAVGLAALVVYLVVLVATQGATSASTAGASTGGTLSHAAWLVHNGSSIDALNRDQRALQSDDPTTGGNAAKWLSDWRTFNRDAVAAASLPNPGGTATVVWREMLNDYANESTEIPQAIDNHDAAELAEAERDVVAGNQAAQRFDQAMGIRVP